MVKRLFTVLVSFLMVSTIFTSYSPTTLSKEKVPAMPPKTYTSPVGFIENKGQWSSEFAFISKTPFGQIGLGKSSIYFNLAGSKENPQNQVIQLSLTGSNHVVPVGVDPYPTNYHFYQGRDQLKWVTNAKMFRSIRFPEIYQGIDLVYLMSGKNPKYEFHVRPGADPSVIKLNVLGATLKTDKKVLSYITPDRSLQDNSLLVFEKQSKKHISSTFLQLNKNSFGFQVASYDKRQTLVIDPVISEIYLGGAGDYERSEGLSEAIDEDGNLYITGYTTSLDFPTTPGAYKPYDPVVPYQYQTFVTKIGTNGAILFSLVIASITSYYDTEGCAIAVTSQHQVVIAGTTDASDFPVTPGAFQSSLRGGFDFFICRFNETGSQLLMSTLVGGTGNEAFYSFGSTINQNYYDFSCNNPIALDSNDNVIISGNTASIDFPLTSGNIKSSSSNSNNQIVIFTMNSAGTNLLYSTYFGGSILDGSLSLISDNRNNIYICGFTFSFDFFTTPGAYRENLIPNGINGFIAKFYVNPDTHVVTPLFSTLLGNYDTFVNSIDYDKDYHIVVTGTTYSATFPTTPGAFRETWIASEGWNYDVFVTTLDATGSTILYSTYMGGSDEDIASSIYVDNSGFAYVVGTTRSSDFPVTPDAFQPTKVSFVDIFIFRINPTMQELSFSTYYNLTWGTMAEANDVIVTEDNLVYFLGSYYIGGGFTPNLPFIDNPANDFKACGVSSLPSTGQVVVGLNFTIPLVFPGDPTLALQASNNTFILDWSAVPGDNPLDGFVLYRSVDGGSFVYYDDFGPSTLTTIDNDIASGTTYRYFIEAYDDHGNYSGLSNIVSYTKPSIPASPFTTTSDSAIVVSWNHSVPGTASVNKYLVYRSEDPTFASPALAGFVASTQNFYKDTDITIGKTYYYKVQAQDSNKIDSFLSTMVSGVVTTIPKPTLGLSIQLNQTEFVKGDAAILKVYVHNLSSTTASGVILSMLLPDALEFSSVDSGYTALVNGKSVSFALGNMPGLSFKEINLICEVKDQVSEDTSAIILFTATCLENVSATGEARFTIKARKTTTSAVSVSIQVQNTEQDPVTGKRFIHLGDPLTVTYEILGGSCPYTVYVDWGDGTKEKIEIKCYQDLEGVLKHTYTSRGTFHIKLKIEDASGQSKDSNFDIDIR